MRWYQMFECVDTNTITTFILWLISLSLTMFLKGSTSKVVSFTREDQVNKSKYNMVLRFELKLGLNIRIILLCRYWITHIKKTQAVVKFRINHQVSKNHSSCIGNWGIWPLDLPIRKPVLYPLSHWGFWREEDSIGTCTLSRLCANNNRDRAITVRSYNKHWHTREREVTEAVLIRPILQKICMTVYL